MAFSLPHVFIKNVTKNVEGLRKKKNWKKYFMILNSNSNLGIQTIEFQILCCIRRPKQGILKSIDFKSGHFKSIGSK